MNIKETTPEVKRTFTIELDDDEALALLAAIGGTPDLEKFIPQVEFQKKNGILIKATAIIARSTAFDLYWDLAKIVGVNWYNSNLSYSDPK